MANKKKKEVTIAESTEEFENDSPEVENFEDFFNYAGEGYSIVINREEPVELKSFLEEIPLDENIFNLEYLAKTWGGKQFRIMLRDPAGKFRARRIINMRSYPPLMRGRKIMDDNDILFGSPRRPQKEDGGESILKAAQVLKSLTPEQPPQMPQNQNDSMMEILKIIITNQMQAMANLQTQQSAPQSSVQNLSDFMQLMSKTRDFWKNPNEPEKISGSDDNAMLGSVVELAKTVLSQPKSQDNTANHRLVTPNPVQPRQLAAVPPPVKAQNQVHAQQQQKSVDEQVSDYLGKMSAVDATKLYLMKFQQQPQEDQEKALEMLCHAMGIDIEDELPDDKSERSGGELSPDEVDTLRNRQGNQRRG